MIISKDAQKAFKKIQQSSMTKACNRTGRQGNYLSVIKAIYEKLKDNILLDSEKLKAGTRQG